MGLPCVQRQARRASPFLQCPFLPHRYVLPRVSPNTMSNNDCDWLGACWESRSLRASLEVCVIIPFSGWKNQRLREVREPGQGHRAAVGSEISLTQQQEPFPSPILTAALWKDVLPRGTCKAVAPLPAPPPHPCVVFTSLCSTVATEAEMASDPAVSGLGCHPALSYTGGEQSFY